MAPACHICGFLLHDILWGWASVWLPRPAAQTSFFCIYVPLARSQRVMISLFLFTFWCTAPIRLQSCVSRKRDSNHLLKDPCFHTAGLEKEWRLSLKTALDISLTWGVTLEKRCSCLLSLCFWDYKNSTTALNQYYGLATFAFYNKSP